MMSLKQIVRYSILMVMLLCNTAMAGDLTVDAMGDAFVGKLPANWNALRGGWQYADIKDCYVNGPSCFGNNPTTPYGSPQFSPNGDSDLVPTFKLKADEAVVIFMRTPPTMRYFGFTQYLFSRAGDTAPVFASLSDTINQLRFATIGSQTRVEQVYDQYAVLVWTANQKTYESLKLTLAQMGITESQINYLPIPINLPLNMGDGESADEFNMLMRTALPEVPENLRSYIDEKPFYVVRVGPSEPVEFEAAPVMGYASDLSGISEDPALQASLNNLVADIKRNYRRTFAFKDQNVGFNSKVGWDCIAGVAKCFGDNHDALYSMDTSRPVVVGDLTDVVVVAGVNHQKTGKALYINHSVYDTIRMAGIVAVADPVFTTQSALFHAGVAMPRDPRVREYEKLYAYAISYNCNGLKYCINIPAPTPENPVGLVPGAPFVVAGRAYVEPHTGVRPNITEMVPHQVLVGSKK